MTLLIGELLVKMGLINEKRPKDALKAQIAEGRRIGEVLIKLGLVSEVDILKALSQQFGIPLIDMEHTEIEEIVIKLISLNTAKRFSVIPVKKSRNILTIAISDPTRAFDLKELQMLTGCDIEPVLTTEALIEEAIIKYYESSHNVELNKFIADFGMPKDTSLEILEEEKKDIASLEFLFGLYPPLLAAG
ncbi:MAG: hypothetical protein NT178_08495 [Proteobacteria bacterium]|nr:hypothetical protein [Pseudomonadota bacterium]